MATNSNVRSETVRNWPAVPEVPQDVEHVADVPVERVPERNRLREQVLVAEGDGDDRVEGDEEEDATSQGAPGRARNRQVQREPIRQPALNFDQALSQSRSPSMLS